MIDFNGISTHLEIFMLWGEGIAYIARLHLRFCVVVLNISF